MPPAPPDELGLRLAIAAERLAGLHGELSGRMAAVEGKLDTLDKALTAHRAEVRPALDAHAAYLARLQAAEDQETAEARARAKTAGTEAATARVEEEAARSRARATALEWALRILVPLLAAALGAGGMYSASTSASTPNPAQDAPGVTP